MYGSAGRGEGAPKLGCDKCCQNKERNMTKFEQFLKQLDQNIVSCKQFGFEYMSYKPRYFSDLPGHVLAGVQIFLPPTTEQEGRLLYISTSMKLFFGEIAAILDAEECAALGVPEEDANNAEAGIYGAFKVVGREGIQTLLWMATDDWILSTATLDMMGLGIEPLGTRAWGGVEHEYGMTCEEPERGHIHAKPHEFGPAHSALSDSPGA
jgi:hypothetical protein